MKVLRCLFSATVCITSWTASVFAAPPDKTSPTPPASLTTSSITCGRVNLSWSPSIDPANGNDTVTEVQGYKVYRNGTLLQQVTTTSFSDSSVTIAATYTYGVSAFDGAQNSSTTNTITVTIPLCPDSTPPNIPAAPSASTLVCNQVNVSWAAVTDRSNPTQQVSGVKGYNVYRGGTLVSFVSNTSMTDMVPGGGATYSYQVSAVDQSNNESARGPAGSVTVPSCPDLTPPNVPAGLSLTALDCSRVSLTWSLALDGVVPNQASTGVKGYNVYRGGAFLVFVTTTNAIDTGLFGATAYSYQVSAVDNVNNESALSQAVPFTTPGCTDTTPPSMPSNLAISSLRCNQLTFSWSPSSDQNAPNQGISGLSGYFVYRDEVLLQFVNSTSFTDGNVVEGNVYRYRVSAVDAASNESAQSSLLEAAVPSCASSPATNLKIVVSNGKVGLQWSGTPGALYQVENAINFGSPWYRVDAPTTSFSSTNLACDPTRMYRVALFTNTPTYLANYSINIRDTTPPGIPAPLSVSAVSAAQVDLSWTPVLDVGTFDSGQGQTYTSGLDRYLIYRDGTYLKSEPANVTSATDRSVASGVQYTYSVAAIDKAGNVSLKVSDSVSTWGGTCTYSLSPTDSSISAAATSGSFFVNADSGCVWSASTTNNWLHTTTSAAGNGAVNYTVDSNSSSSSRVGTITVAGRGYIVIQAGAAAGCTYTISSSAAGFPSAGGSSNVTVTTSSGCSWNVSNSPFWLTITSNSNGIGSASVDYVVAANASTSARSATLTIAGNNYTVSQNGNQAPIANAGPNLSLSIGATTTFTADGSSDPDGSISSYDWVFGDGFTASGFSVSHAYSILGVYTVTLTVTDNLGARATDSLLATILAIPDITPPTVNLTVPGSPNANGVVNLVANASDNVGVTKTEFYRDGIVFTNITGSPYSTSFDTRTLANGSHTFLAKAYDAANNNNSSSVTVLVDNSAPTVTLTQPINGSTVSNIITLAASASDNSGGSGLSRVEFYCDSLITPLGMDGSAPYTNSFDTRTIPNGTHNLHCRAYDAAGNWSNSTSIAVTINNQVIPQNPWAKRFGGSGSESGLAVALDGSGNIFVAGYFQGLADFGGGILTSSGGYDVVLAKYSSSGAHLWSKRFGGSGNEQVSSIALDPAGNILVAGSFYGTGNFGGANLTSAGDADAFVAKYSSQGDPIWSQRFGSNYPDVIKSIAIDSQSNVVICGFLQGTVLIGTTTVYSWGVGIDAFIAKFAPDGSNLWAKNFYNAGTEFGNTVAVDKRINPLTSLPYDNIVMVGYFDGYINLAGGQADANLLTSAGGYIAKFSPTGNHIWSKGYGGSNGSTRFWSLALDSNGDVAVSGDFPLQTDLGAGPINGASWGTDMFVAKYSGADGSYRWATPILGFQASLGRPIAMGTDSQNNVLLTGYFQGTFNFGVRSMTSSSGVADGMMAKFSTSGAPVWAQSFGSSGAANAYSIGVDSMGNCVTTGYFTGTATCAGQLLTSAGAIDFLLVKLNP
jgi:fibronectin type 3 domain-containing protein